MMLFFSKQDFAARRSNSFLNGSFFVMVIIIESESDGGRVGWPMEKFRSSLSKSNTVSQRWMERSANRNNTQRGSTDRHQSESAAYHTTHYYWSLRSSHLAHLLNFIIWLHVFLSLPALPHTVPQSHRTCVRMRTVPRWTE